MVDFADQAYPEADRQSTHDDAAPRAERATRASRARCSQLVAEGRPLTEAMTTQQLMMTHRAEGALRVPRRLAGRRRRQGHRPLPRSAPDTGHHRRGGGGAHPDRTDARSRRARTTCTGTTPTSRPTRHATSRAARQDPIVYTRRARSRLHYLLYGSLDGRKNPTPAACSCPPFGGTADGAAARPPHDFSDWKMVTIRPPVRARPSRRSTTCPRCARRTSSCSTMPRVGFFSTPAFFANWQTNTSNQMRVTMNQTLIVGARRVGRRHRPDHAPDDHPGSTRRTPRQAGLLRVPPDARPDAVDLRVDVLVELPRPDRRGVRRRRRGSSPSAASCKPVDDARRLRDASSPTHPLFARGLGAEALLLRELGAVRHERPGVPAHRRASSRARATRGTRSFASCSSSPLTTNAAPTKTPPTNGEVVAVVAARPPVRRAQRAPRLRRRVRPRRREPQGDVADDRSPRSSRACRPTATAAGRSLPVLPNEPTLFYRAGTENICERVAAAGHRRAPRQAAGAPGVKQWSSAAARRRDRRLRAASSWRLAPSDPRRRAGDDAAQGALHGGARRRGATASDALKSTFVAACLAPSAVSIGL